jgi:hypothetical protein
MTQKSSFCLQKVIFQKKKLKFIFRKTVHRALPSTYGKLYSSHWAFSLELIVFDPAFAWSSLSALVFRRVRDFHAHPSLQNSFLGTDLPSGNRET